MIRDGAHWTILLDPSETKGGRPLEYPLPPTIGQAVDCYLARFRPALFGSQSHNGFWASAKGYPMSSDAVYAAVYRRTNDAFGAPMNLHLFRDAAATFWATADPKRIRVAGDLLGHANPATTERHYNQAQSVEAGRRLAAALDARRR